MTYEGYNLVCVHSFQHHVTAKKYEKGDMITDPAEVEFLHIDKEHHFNRIAAPPVALPEPAVAETKAPIHLHDDN